MNTKHLKTKILDLAIRGKLVLQDSSEGNAADLLKKIREEKSILIEQKKIKADKNSSFIIKAENGRHYEQFANGTLKDIGDEIPFEIPENWCWCRLSEISNSIIAGGDRPAICTKEKTSENIIPIYANAIEKDGLYGYTNKPQITEKAITISARGTIGFSCIREHPFVPIVRLIVLVPNLSIIDLKYLKASFDALLNMTEGSSIPQLTIPSIKTFLFPLPPLSEQQRIVSTIEKAFEQIDIIEKNKLNLKTYIKQTKSKVLDLAIHGKLVEQNPSEGNAFELLEKIRKENSELVKQKKIKEDKKSSFIIKAEDGKHYEQFADGTLKDIEDEIPFEIPENWSWCRLREIGNWQSGCTPDKSRKDFYDKADIPWLNSGDLTDSYIENIPHYVSQIAFDEKKMKLNEAGSVCIAMYGATIGKLGILTKSATTNQAVLVCSKLHLSDSKYLFYFLKSHKKEYIQAGFGGAQPNISKEKVEPTLFPLPPLEEQKRIVGRIEQIFEQLDILEKSIGD